MSQSLILNQLDLVEQQFNEVSAVMVEGIPASIQAASAAFQHLAVDFVHLLEQAEPYAVRQGSLVTRLKSLSEGIAQLRANLLRRAAYVEQALQIVVPIGPSVTYAGGSPYGTGIRQTGAFKVLCA